MKVIILGSNGFLGSNLCDFLKSCGFKIKKFDSQDYMDKVKVIRTIVDTDLIINCIGSASVEKSYLNSKGDFDSNVGVIKNILQIVCLNNLNSVKIINLSSAAVYGNPSILPVRESDYKNPVSPYGYHKLISEILLEEYSKCFGLKTLSLRIFSAYGRGQCKLLLWDIHKKIQEGNGEIQLFGSGDESRDYIHINDIAQQVLLAIQHAKFEGEALNVANGSEVQIKQVVQLYKQFYPKQFNYSFSGDIKQGDPLRWCADIEKMKMWGYQQTVNLEDGIKDYIDWVSKN